MLTLLSFSRRLRVVVLVLLAAIAVVSIDRYVAFRRFGWLTPYFRTDTHADGLLAGALLAQLWVRGRTPAQGVRLLGWTCLAGFVVLLRTARTENPWLYAGGFTLVNCGTAVVILALLNGGWLPGQVLSTQAFVVIGRTSYGAYCGTASRTAPSWRGFCRHFPLSRDAGTWADRCGHYLVLVRHRASLSGVEGAAQGSGRCAAGVRRESHRRRPQARHRSRTLRVPPLVCKMTAAGRARQNPTLARAPRGTALRSRRVRHSS